MNNYKSFSELKEELGNNYDFKLYEMGISALKEIENLQQENKQLQEELEYTVGIVEHNRIISEKNKEIHQLKDNWNKLKEYLENKIDEYSINLEYLSAERMTQIKNKMQEIERGVSDVKD